MVVHCPTPHNVLSRKEGVSVLTKVLFTLQIRSPGQLLTAVGGVSSQRPSLSTTPRLSVLDTSCNVFVLKQQGPSSQPKKGITPMGTLFVESLKRLEAEMATNTRNPLSLLQLTMRFLSFLLSFFLSSHWNALMLLRLVIRLKQSEGELPLTLRQKLANEVINNVDSTSFPMNTHGSNF